MQSGIPCRRGRRLIVVAASLRHPCRRHAVSRSPSRSSFSSATLLFAKGRYQDALEAYQNALKAAPPDQMRAAARAASSQSALRVAEFDLRARRGREAGQGESDARPRRWRCTATRCGRRASSRRPRAQYRDALAIAPELARGHHGMARALAARSQLDEAMDEAQAALRLSPRDLEIHHTVGAIYERMHKYEEAAGAFTQLRQPAAEQGPQRQGRLVARRDPVPALVRPARAVRDGSRRRRPALHRRLPAGERQGRGARQGQRRLVAGLRRRHRRGEHRASRGRPRSGSASRRSPTRSAPASATSGCAACSWRGSTRSSSGTLKLRNVPVPDQESAAARHPGEGDREPVAARARLLDDHRLQDAQAHVRQAPARRSRATSSCRCGCTGWRRCAARSTARTRRTSSSTPAGR